MMSDEATSNVSILPQQAQNVLRFYRVYARRSSDFSVVDEEFDCAESGGPKAEFEARRCAARLRHQGYDQVKIDLCIVHPIYKSWKAETSGPGA